ncbi:cell wall-active antibiotics response protein [Streptacidiphilus sp. PB12-B1b]|uniref:PspC domain-containing protein n=1 Tax=Streptacidiphilus sp. PB12-B1b TaxID=2705012 RepID=UPI0015FD2D42|nr:PspC domain-containing protein [Streptacidiphilus sp. PB12-B1b]QMU79265.1 cell wall-active antibiotics response protein [Streptacidiphilus sp. PB12-B1b]
MTEDAVPPEDGQAPPPPGRPSDPPVRTSRPPLERSASHRVVTGVCGGVGRHLDIDPVVFRVVVAVLCLSGGVGLFIYGMAWLIIPVERTGRNELQRLLSGKVDGQSLGAVLVTVLGTGIFFSYMGSSGHLFPLLLIALLAFAALRYDPDAFEARRRQSQPAAAQAAAGPVAPDATTPPAPAWWQRPDPLLKREAATATATAAAAAPGTGVAEPPEPRTLLDAQAQAERELEEELRLGALPPEPPEPPAAPGPGPWPAQPGQQPGQQPWERTAPRAERPPRRSRSHLGAVFFCLAVITGGVVWIVGEHSRPGVDLEAVLASALLVLGVGLLLGARWGRARSLVLWGVLLTLAVAAVGASPVRLSTTYQHVDWAPAGAAALLPSYRLSTGAAVLDLGTVAPAAGQTVASDVRLGAGRLTVELPSGPEVRLHVSVGVGAMRLPDGLESGGVSSSHTEVLNPAGAAAHGTIDLDVSVGAGQAEVTR